MAKSNVVSLFSRSGNGKTLRLVPQPKNTNKVFCGVRSFNAEDTRVYNIAGRHSLELGVAERCSDVVDIFHANQVAMGVGDVLRKFHIKGNGSYTKLDISYAMNKLVKLRILRRHSRGNRALFVLTSDWRNLCAKYGV